MRILEGLQVQKVYVRTALVVPSCAARVCAAAHSLVCSASHPSFRVRALLLQIEEL